MNFKTMIKKLTKKQKIAIIAIGSVLVLFIIIALTKNGGNGTDYVEIEVALGDIQPTVLSTGTVSPENRLEIKPPIAGRIDDVLVDEGAEVKKGQILVKMSSTERAALLDAARAQGGAELERWLTYYRPAPILAPINGTIIVRSVESGQTVTNSDVILVMSDRLTVKARVDETDIGSIKLKQKADIVLDAYPDETIPGLVDKIAYDSKTVNNVTTYIVDVLPNEIPEHMRSGMTANVTFYLDSKENVPFLPANAVQIRSKRSFVLVKPESRIGDPVEKDVKTGLSDGNRLEMLEGIKVGEKVLVERLKMPNGDSNKSNPFFPSRPKAKGSK